MIVLLLDLISLFFILLNFLSAFYIIVKIIKHTILKIYKLKISLNFIRVFIKGDNQPSINKI